MRLNLKPHLRRAKIYGALQETAKFASLIRAAKFKGAVRGSVKFQRAKSKPDFARRLQAA